MGTSVLLARDPASGAYKEIKAVSNGDGTWGLSVGGISLNASGANFTFNTSGLAAEQGGNSSITANNSALIAANTLNMAAALAAQNAILGNGTQNVTVSNQRINITNPPLTLVAGTSSTNSATNVTGRAVVVSATVDAYFLITTNGTNANATNSSPSIFVGAGSYTFPITANNLSNGSFKVAAIAANTSAPNGTIQVLNMD